MHALWHWLDRNILELGREMRLSYLPPLMVYMAAGISGLTGIVGTFFVKDYLSLSAEFLAALGFWAGVPWALKMPLGHLVDLIWRWKGLLVYLGASLIVPRYSRYLVDLNRPSENTPMYAGQNNTELCPTRFFTGEPLYRPGQAPDEAQAWVLRDQVAALGFRDASILRP